MPIIEGTVGETIIQLGDGDVLVCTARQPENSFDNEVCFVRDEPHPVGDYSEKYAGGNTTTADIDCPVRIQFTKAESVDVLIERLSKVRAQMTAALPRPEADEAPTEWGLKNIGRSSFLTHKCGGYVNALNLKCSGCGEVMPETVFQRLTGLAA
jgi:hypothetical protein